VSGRSQVLLEGRPGSGKTTAARRTAELLRTAGVRIAGFITEEIRGPGRRSGFSVMSLDGESAVLAHVNLPGPPRVGKYGVDLEAFQRVALPTLQQSSRTHVVIIDEIGKMELASAGFQDAVQELFDSELPLIATVHVFSHPFTDALKRRPGVELIPLNARNRDTLPEELARRFGGGRAALKR
jgi:nucleoside-triphosphatase